MVEQKAVVSCPSGHEWPADTKFCGICGSKILDSAKIGNFIVSAGQIGNEIVLDYLGVSSTEERPERIVVLDVSSQDLSKFSEAASSLPESSRSKVSTHLLGSSGSGTGHMWKRGERAASDDASLEEFWVKSGVKNAEVVFLVCSLGGGTAAGAGPHVLDKIFGLGANCERISFVLLPFDDEPDIAHFNAYCGLSRLLKFSGRQNADFIILLTATNVQKHGSTDFKGNKFNITKTAAMILELMANSGSSNVYRWLSPVDLSRMSRSVGILHAVPCVALNHSVRIYGELEGILESACLKPLANVDPETVIFAPALLRIPKPLKGKMKEEELMQQYSRWRNKTFAGNVVGELSIAYVDRYSDKIDAFLLLGGCDLDQTLSRTNAGYHQVKNSIATRRLEDYGMIPVQEQPLPEDLVPLEKNLNDYVANIRMLPRRRP